MTSSILISQRLKTIAEYVPADSRVADIGSDHALLASYLLVNHIASFVIAGELNEGPYQAALRQLATLQAAKDRSSVRKGNGLAVLTPGETDVICIAGMGGQLIASILDAGLDKLGGVSRLILQPNVGEEVVRRWFIQHGWQLIDETILEEDGIIYEILVAEPGEPLTPYQDQDRTPDELLAIGPFLWTKKQPVMRQKWEHELEKWEKILTQMEKSDKPETQERKEEIKTQMNWIKGVLACL
ncbi:tRNA (adenine(22)-N(1))-methyltransferase [Brevibacillus dissolubilis]|uniref:tRNA (adenine(22)-N(1))-methyltransferase n=1 Tax=Brevibacillus dissolubilis TaxID=1844116 RepID=UPI0011173CDB|nr:tRNA (adenine(22)-N(1))-methyltransferase TrmK [Brevibacillus dissolubilis]